MKCEVCGTELKKITTMHLKGPKCKEYKGERLSEGKYNEIFKIKPEKPLKCKLRRKNVFKLLQSIDLGMIDEEIEETSKKIKELKNNLNVLEILKKIISSKNNGTIALKSIQEVNQVNQEKMQLDRDCNKVYTYLFHYGEASISRLQKALSWNRERVIQSLNALIEQRKVIETATGYKLLKGGI